MLLAVHVHTSAVLLLQEPANHEFSPASTVTADNLTPTSQHMPPNTVGCCKLCCLLQVPADYDSTYKHFAAQGARVIALARRALPIELDGPELRNLPREEVESDMEFQGFAIFQVRRSIRMTPSSILSVLPGVMSPEGVLHDFWFRAGYATAVGL
jgi:hypothetical protein